MNQFLLPILSKAINAYLSLDPESKHRLQKLQGNIITVELLPFHFIFQCLFTVDAIEIQMGETHPAVAKIKGTPMQMLGALTFKANRHRFFADDLKIEGNADIGLELIELFDSLEIDWEEYCSKVTGDVPAYHLGRMVRGFKKWTKQTDHTLQRNITEYIQEEKQWLPSREALQDFFHDIDNARMDADRLEARIYRLEEIS